LTSKRGGTGRTRGAQGGIRGAYGTKLKAGAVNSPVRERGKKGNQKLPSPGPKKKKKKKEFIPIQKREGGAIGGKKKKSKAGSGLPIGTR